MGVIASQTNSSAAFAFASSTGQYAEAAASAGAGSAVSENSVYELEEFNLSTCSVLLNSVHAVYEVQNATGSWELDLSENPQLTMVSSLSIHQVFQSFTAGLWNGWAVASPSSPAWGNWNIPQVGVPASVPNCGHSAVNYCDLGIWVGQTNQYGGTNGISQVGTDQLITCTQVLWWWDCSESYTAWYEFSPAIDPVTCYSASAGDDISATTSYNGSSHKYSVQAVDFNNNQACSSTSPTNFTMGSPLYGNWIAEDPVINGGNPTLSGFHNFTFSMGDPLGKPVCSGKVNDLLCVTQPPPFHDNSVLTIGSPFYGKIGNIGSVNCQTYTCFTVTGY